MKICYAVLASALLAVLLTKVTTTQQVVASTKHTNNQRYLTTMKNHEMDDQKQVELEPMQNKSGNGKENKTSGSQALTYKCAAEQTRIFRGELVGDNQAIDGNVSITYSNSKPPTDRLQDWDKVQEKLEKVENHEQLITARSAIPNALSNEADKAAEAFNIIQMREDTSANLLVGTQTPATPATPATTATATIASATMADGSKVAEAEFSSKKAWQGDENYELNSAAFRSAMESSIAQANDTKKNESSVSADVLKKNLKQLDKNTPSEVNAGGKNSTSVDEDHGIGKPQDNDLSDQDSIDEGSSVNDSSDDVSSDEDSSDEDSSDDKSNSKAKVLKSPLLGDEKLSNISSNSADSEPAD
ncbi:hypothetical protein CCR75_005961 [Bremia lactucae]|uniref:RxLR effector protein n=1 Tax=Bremia lactucae TaxID=4779 RepID=A0A976FIN4_BRELC|nr:hypothetical protein CCR75_005961 [Bremia lactucae]